MCFLQGIFQSKLQRHKPIKFNKHVDVWDALSRPAGNFQYNNYSKLWVSLIPCLQIAYNQQKYLSLHQQRRMTIFCGWHSLRMFLLEITLLCALPDRGWASRGSEGSIIHPPDLALAQNVSQCFCGHSQRHRLQPAMPKKARYVTDDQTRFRAILTGLLHDGINDSLFRAYEP